MLKIVYCFVNPGWVEFLLFLVELKRYVFLIYWPVCFSYMPFWLEVVLSCAIVSIGDFYGKVVAVI